MINGETVPTRAVMSGLAEELTAMSPSSRSWPLKSNRDAGQNTKAPTLDHETGGL
jgi:hypothetical protein